MLENDDVKLYCGDCLEIMKEIPDGSVDFILTDPPYQVTACRWDKIIPFEPMWEQINRIIKPNGAIALFGSEPFSSALRMSNIKNYKYDWVWDKCRGVGHLNAKIRPMMQTENISIFSNKKTNYYPQMRDRDTPRISKNHSTQNVYGKSEENFIGEKLEKRYPINILRFSKSDMTKNNFHPTQKPVALLEYLIKTYTLEGETVLDFTMGSGSTGVAAVNAGRKFIGIELDENYFKIAEDRISSAGQQNKEEKHEQEHPNQNS